MGEAIRIKYKELFTLNCRHSAYTAETGSLLFDKIKIRPDAATKNIFQRYDINSRWEADSLICFIRSERVFSAAKEPQKPFIPLVEPLRLRFLITASQAFITNTYVITAGSGSVYYFTNKTSNSKDQKNHLSLPLENYSLSKNYDAGTLIKSNGDLYTAIQPVLASSVIPLSNPAYWKKLANGEEAVNNADLAFVSDVKNEEPCFGVMDVFTDGITHIDYHLFSPAKEMLSPVYHLYFKSKI